LPKTIGGKIKGDPRRKQAKADEGGKKEGGDKKKKDTHWGQETTSGITVKLID